MTVPIIAFFNNKGGVGKTLLVYHLAWMYRNLGLRRASRFSTKPTTAAFLDEERLEELWEGNNQPKRQSFAAYSL